MTATHALVYISDDCLDMLQVGTFEELLPGFTALRKKFEGIVQMFEVGPDKQNIVMCGCDTVLLVPLTFGFFDRFGLGKDVIYRKHIKVTQ